MSSGRKDSDISIDRIRARAAIYVARESSTEQEQHRLGSLDHSQKELDFDSAGGWVMDLEDQVAAALREDIRESNLSRPEIAGQLTTLLRRTITLAQVDAWCSLTNRNRFPADALPAWVLVTGSRRVLELLAAGAGLYVIGGEERELVEFARVEIEARRVAERRRELRQRLMGSSTG